MIVSEDELLNDTFVTKKRKTLEDVNIKGLVTVVYAICMALILILNVPVVMMILSSLIVWPIYKCLKLFQPTFNNDSTQNRLNTQTQLELPSYDVAIKMSPVRGISDKDPPPYNVAIANLY